MKNFFQIGEVAKFYNISLDTLRLYDKIGLLKPALVKENGYRYYSNKQLDTLEIILLGKDLNISLEEIKNKLLTGNIADQLDLMKQQNEKIERKIKELELSKRYTGNMIRLLQSAPDYPNTLPEPAVKDVDINIYCPKDMDYFPKFASVWDIYAAQENRFKQIYGFSMLQNRPLEKNVVAESYRLKGPFQVFSYHTDYNTLTADLQKLDADFIYINYLFICLREKEEHDYFVDIYVKSR